MGRQITMAEPHSSDHAQYRWCDGCLEGITTTIRYAGDTYLVHSTAGIDRVRFLALLFSHLVKELTSQEHSLHR